MLRSLLLALMSALALPSVGFAQSTCSPAGPPATLTKCTFSSGPHINRWYRLNVPAGAATRPLIVVLHGGGTLETNGANDMRTVVNQSADMESDALNGGTGLIVAYPRSGTQTGGVLYQWNLGPEACGVLGTCLDDVLFVNAVIADIKNTQSVDAAQVAIAGHSGGGFMVLRMACEPSGNPHGTVLWAVSASLTAGEVAACTNSATTRLFLVNGTQDDAVPYIGTVAYGSEPIGIETLPVGRAAFSVIALGARQGSVTAWGGSGQQFNADSLAADGNCFINAQHTGVNVIVATVGPGAAAPILTGPPSNWPGSNVPCYATGGTAEQNGGGHRWPGYTGDYGIGKKTTFFNLSNSIIATVTGG